MSFPISTHYHNPHNGGAFDAIEINTRHGNLDFAIKTANDRIDLITGTITVTAGEGLLANRAAYINPADGLAYAIDADALPPLTSTIRGIVTANANISQPVSLKITGILTGFSGLTPFATLYVSDTGDGTLTQTRPIPALDGAQVAIIPMGVAVSATEVDVLPSVADNAIRYQRRFSPVQDDTLTIVHHSNPDGFGRIPRAYVTGAKTLTEYGSANQDTDVQLRGISAPGDTQSFNTGITTNTAIGDASGSEFRVAQSFQLGADGVLTQFTFELGANDGSPTGDLHWEIRTDSGGSGPTSAGTTILASGDIANGTVLASSTNTVAVTNGPFLTAATTYWIVLHADAQSNNVRWVWLRNTSGTYASGECRNSSNNGSTWSASLGDAGFSVTASAMTALDALAQGFQLSATASPKTVRLWLKKVGAPTGNLTVKIETDNAGNPSGTIVTNGTSATVAASSLSTSYAWIEFTFTTPPALTASTQYHIVLETTDAASNINYVIWGADASSPAYASGEMKSEAASTWSALTADAIFAVAADGLQYLNAVNVDYWDSTLADIVNRVGDSGGADLDTKTTFKCTKAAGFADMTCEVIAP